MFFTTVNDFPALGQGIQLHNNFPNNGSPLLLKYSFF